jgi:hypothetical protein
VVRRPRFSTELMIPHTPQSAETAPIQPWYGAIFAISSLASGFLAMMRFEAPRTPRTASQTPK